MATNAALNGSVVQLVRALEAVDRSRVAFTVALLDRSGPLLDRLTATGWPVVGLDRRSTHDPFAFGRLVRLVDPARFDVLYALKHTGALWARAAAELRRFRPVVTHDKGFPLHLLSGWNAKLDAFQTRRSDHVLANSRHTRSVLVEHLGVSPGRVSVLYNGIDTAAVAAPRPAPDEPVLGFLGRLSPEKGPDLFLRAVAEAQRVRPVHAMLCGRGPDEPALRRLAASLDIAGRVTFLDGDADPVETIQRFSVLVVPSRYESFGLTLLEAALAGRPVVATRTAALPEVAGLLGNAVLVDPAPGTEPETGAGPIPGVARLRGPDPADTARAALDVLRDDILRRELTGDAVSRVREHFSLDAHVRGFEDALVTAASRG